MFFVIYNRYHPFDKFKTHESLAKHVLNIYHGKDHVSVKNIGDNLLQQVIGGMLEGKWKERSKLSELEKVLK